MLLCDWLKKWLALYVEGEVRPSTLAMYRRSIAALPDHIAQTDLKGEHVFALLCDLRTWQIERSRATPRAAQLDRIMITRALRKAAALGLIGKIDFDEALPHVKHSAAEAVIFTPEELRRYLEAVPVYADDLEPVLFLLCCGLRRGEALGVRWEDIDMTTGILRITGQIQRQGGHLVRVPLKSRSAYRAIRLPDFVIASIRRWGTIGGGSIIVTTPERVRRTHLKIIQGEGLPAVTLHGLRHSFAVAAAASGCSMQQLRLALGHSKIALTADLYAGHQAIASPLPCSVLAQVASL